MAEAAANGDSWDFPGGLPDPVAEAKWNDAVVFATTTVSDTLYPEWNASGNLVINSGGEVCIRVYDEDASGFEFIDGACWEGDDSIVALVRGSVDDPDFSFGNPLYDGLAGVFAYFWPNF